jgi:class 3 adenylate cyclase/Arc/MetJ-type ribon-helix-helix transcriptional regulator
VRPETRYAKSGEVSVAYQVVGEGPFDLVLVPGFVSNVEYAWEEPGLADFYRRLGSFCRLIVFDKRGTGLSDRIHGVPTLETRMDDVRAIMDAVGSVMYGSYLAWDWMAAGRFRSRHESVRAALEEIERRWGAPDYCDELLENDAPSKLGDDRFRDWYATRLRLSASPRAAVDLQRMNVDTDTREVVKSIRVPTLVVHRVGDRNVDVKNARYAAEQIPGARYVELPGDDHLPWVGDSDRIVEELRRFLGDVWETGAWQAEPDRVLATVLFTDIVGSTEAAVELGDARWRELLAEHHSRIRRELTRFRGRELDTAGDGFFASFDGPARAVRCAVAIRETMSDLGLQLRIGLHTGECEELDGKFGGIAVVTGARIAGLCAPGEILTSSTVRDLVAGSGIAFEERGEHELKGLPDRRHVYAVVHA